MSSIVLIEGVLTEAGKIAVFFIGMPTLPPLNES